jgi:hypothetical protein
MKHSFFALWCAIALAVLPVSAQMMCMVSAMPTQVRVEGVTEHLGDIVIICDGGIPTAAGHPIPLMNVSVALSNSQFTNRVFVDGTADALLLIDDPFPADPFPNGATGPAGNSGPQKFCVANGVSDCSLTGTGGMSNPYQNTKNVFQGIATTLSGVVYLEFLGVPIDPPGADNVRVLRIANLRGDITPIPAGQTVNAIVSISGLSIANPFPVVAFAFQGITPVASPGSSTQINIGGAEGFASSFKTAVVTSNDQAVGGGLNTVRNMVGGAIEPQNIPGGPNYYTESALTILPATFSYTGSGIGEASHGTWLMVALGNIPAGVQITAPGSVAGDLGSPNLLLYRVDIPPGGWQFNTAFYASAPADKLVVDTTGASPPTSAYIVYEVVADDPTVLESFHIPLSVNAQMGVSTAGITTALLFAPTPEAPVNTGAGSAWELPSTSYDVPRFLATGQFSDVPPSATYYDAANLMFLADVTTGCVQGSTPQTRSFCPDDDVTRQEMAAFIVRAVTGTTNPAIYETTPYFNDVTSANNNFFPHIQKLMDLGITNGCSQSPPLFCPTETIPRWEMAMFMIRARLALHGASFTSSATPYFADVPTNVEGNGQPFPYIQRAYEENVTHGCGTNPLVFCPDELVTRGQMASFIMRALFNETTILATGAPYLTGASPNAVALGGQITVTITGANTSFQNGDTVTVPSGVLAVSSVVVKSATSISATLTVNGNAVAGPQALVVTTGGQNLTLPLVIKVGTY